MLRADTLAQMDVPEFPEMEVPPFQAREHYASIAHLLRAAGFESAVFTNGLTMGIQVASINDAGVRSIVVWGNHDTTWAFTVVDREEAGRIRTMTTDLASYASPEDVAAKIVTQNYDDAS
jgi:hypothetical protein